MSEVFLQGLELTAAGLGLTFLALGVLVVAILTLERLFRGRPLIPEERQITEGPGASTMARDTEDEEVAAAIAIALAYFRLQDISRSGLGTSLETGQGPWWYAGRQYQQPLRPSQPGPAATVMPPPQKRR